MLDKLYSKITNNLLLKITSLNAVAVLFQIVGGFITSKLIAIYLGERGMALLGYLRNFLTTSQTAGNLGYSNGIIKYVASYKKDHLLLSKVLSSSVIISFISSIVVSIVLFVGAQYWNNVVFGQNTSYVFIFKYLAFVIPFITINGVLIAIINGQSAYKKVVWINILTNIIGVGITSYLITAKGVEGALMAMVITPAIALLITLILIGKEAKTLTLLTAKISFKALKKMSSYTVMAVFSMMVLPLIYIAIRNQIVTSSGIEGAGYWDAMTRISDYYIKFVATVMTLYILPQLAKATTDKAFRKEIFGFYKTVLPLFGIGLIVLFLFRTFIIQLLFTEDFIPVSSLFKWQLLGDFFKVASIVIGYQIIAKNNLKLFLITEIISLIVIYSSGIYFVQLYGYEGGAIGHCLSYFVHLLMLLFIFRKPLFGKIIEASA